MITDALARAIEARHWAMGSGPSDRWETEKYESNGKPRSFNSALDNVVGVFVFGTAASQTSGKAGMPQIRLGGVAPKAGGNHFAPPSGCFP